MARSKKKKWKSRIKKALKLAAIGGATYLAAKRFGGKKATVADTAASEDANIGVTHPALAADAPVTGVVNPNLNKVVSDSPIRKDIYRGSGKMLSDSGQTIGAGGLQDGQSRGQLAQIMQAKANAPKGIYPPGMKPTPRTGVGPRRFSKGGRVTGIAKRGFGRALMKGKK